MVLWIDPVNVRLLAKFEVRIFTCSWDNSDWSFGRACELPIYKRVGRRGLGMVLFERALVTSYRPSIVTFPLSLHVSDIAAFVLRYATFSQPHL